MEERGGEEEGWRKKGDEGGAGGVKSDDCLKCSGLNRVLGFRCSRVAFKEGFEGVIGFNQEGWSVW